MTTDYTNRQIFPKGARVEFHPGMDLWMRGTRYGIVVRVPGPKTPAIYFVHADGGPVVMVPADRLRPVR